MTSTDAIREELAAARAGKDVLRWQFSRAKCAAYAVGMPVALAVISVLLLAGETIPVEPAALFALVLFDVVFSLLTIREFALIALFGGGFTASPGGLRFELGRNGMLFPWTAIAGAGVEGRQSGAHGYRVLAIRFATGGYRWPRAFSLWFSEPTCLCVSPYILSDRAAVVGAGIIDARDRFSGPDAPFVTGPPEPGVLAFRPVATPSDEPYTRALPRQGGRRHSLQGRAVAVGCALFAAIAVYWLVTAVQRADVLSALAWLVAAVILAFIGWAAWRFWDDEEPEDRLPPGTLA